MESEKIHMCVGVYIFLFKILKLSLSSGSINQTIWENANNYLPTFLLQAEANIQFMYPIYYSSAKTTEGIYHANIASYIQCLNNMYRYFFITTFYN